MAGAAASPTASADLLLHPVRLRILKAFLGDRALTTGQLAAELDDVAAGARRRRAHPVSDGADYRLAAMWLTDAEYAGLRRPDGARG
jgi:hypothetical protein